MANQEQTGNCQYVPPWHNERLFFVYAIILSFEVGGHWLLWRGWKKQRMTTQDR